MVCVCEGEVCVSLLIYKQIKIKQIVLANVVRKIQRYYFWLQA